jgi:mitochondrial fission protein ELM1
MTVRGDTGRAARRLARVWCLLGRKAGDNTQVRALARGLGLYHEEKTITAHSWELLAHLGTGATLAGIDRRASSPLQPPWPDLVLSAGRRNEPVAQWIRRQSGGTTRLVHVGRPWAALDRWDLIVTTPQYFLPQRDNVLHNQLPLHALDAEELAAAAEQFVPRLAGLPRPWITLLVGGDSGRFVLTPDKGGRLATLASELAARCGGSLLVTDSPRTPAGAANALCRGLSVPHFSHRWSRSAANPYPALLALADAFVVTGESMSMLAEARALGRPLAVFDPGDHGRPWWRWAHNYRYKPLSHRLAMAVGPRRMRRDVGRIQTQLVGGGEANWLDEDSLAAIAEQVGSGVAGKPDIQLATNADLQRAVAAVRRLLPAR